MAVYKRYNTRRKRIPAHIIFCAVAVLVAFSLTVILGHSLGKKAEGGEPLYTGTDNASISGSNLSPLSEKSLHGEYVAPEKIVDFKSDDENVWASTWIYKDGKATFLTETDKTLDGKTASLPALSSFDIDAGTIGLFEVTSIYADDLVKKIITEYEHALLSEFSASSLDEVVLVFNEVTEDNLDEIFEFADGFGGAKVICVPYEMLGNDVFFSKASSKRLPVAIKADGITAEKLEQDIDTYAFYFTKYNLRLVLDGKDQSLLEVLSKNTLLNYQFHSPAGGGNK